MPSTQETTRWIREELVKEVKRIGWLRNRRRGAYDFNSHDLATVATIADCIAIMYVGVIVEVGPPETVLSAPDHPYTWPLVQSILQLSQGWLDEVLDQLDKAPHPPGLRIDASCQPVGTGLGLSA